MVEDTLSDIDLELGIIGRLFESCVGVARVVVFIVLFAPQDILFFTLWTGGKLRALEGLVRQTRRSEPKPLAVLPERAGRYPGNDLPPRLRASFPANPLILAVAHS